MIKLHLIKIVSLLSKIYTIKFGSILSKKIYVAKGDNYEKDKNSNNGHGYRYL